MSNKLIEPLYKLSHRFSESLILAQSERWRRGLGMQVERSTTTFNIAQVIAKVVGDSGRLVSNA